MKRVYTNPAYPIENNSRAFSEPLILSASLNCEQLYEAKTAVDILEIYFYNNKKESENIVNLIEESEKNK